MNGPATGPISTRMFARPALALALVLGVAATGVAGATAQDGTPVAGGPAIPDGCVVVAEGLLNPRHLELAEDGTLYISEAGIGGPDEVPTSEVGTSEIGTPAAGAEEEASAAAAVVEATPENARAENAESGGEEEAAAAEGEGENPFANSTRGYTGQISVVTPDGEQSVLSDGFLSYSDGVGPSGLALAGDILYVGVGGTGVIGGQGSTEGENEVFAVDVTTGEATSIADLGAFEEENNPDGLDVNPNQYGLGLGPDGLLYAVDAGGNTVYTVDPATGEFALFATFPTLDVLLGGDGTPGADDPAAGRQVVPTDVAFTIDGEPIISFLSEFWPEGSPSLVTVGADGTVTALVDDLTTVVAIQPGPDSFLYVTQLSTDLSTFAPGNVLRVDVTTGESEIVLDNLMAPHGLAFDDAGGMYVITGAVAMGPEPSGQVLYCEGIADGTAGTGGALAAAPVATRP